MIRTRPKYNRAFGLLLLAWRMMDGGCYADMPGNKGGPSKSMRQITLPYWNTVHTSTWSPFFRRSLLQVALSASQGTNMYWMSVVCHDLPYQTSYSQSLRAC